MPLRAGKKKLLSIFTHWADDFEGKKIKQQQALWKCG
jgi:hypothetical protein